VLEKWYARIRKTRRSLETGKKGSFDEFRGVINRFVKYMPRIRRLTNLPEKKDEIKKFCLSSFEIKKILSLDEIKIILSLELVVRLLFGAYSIKIVKLFHPNKMDSSNSTLGHEKIPWDWHLIRRGKSCKLLRITPTIPTPGQPSMLELERAVFLSRMMRLQIKPEKSLSHWPAKLETSSITDGRENILGCLDTSTSSTTFSHASGSLNTFELAQRIAVSRMMSITLASQPLRITPTIPTAGHPSMLELGRVQPGLVFLSRINTKGEHDTR
jgi:hypothetical protein